MSEKLSAKNLHKPFAENNCLECHLFHGYENRQILSGSIIDICSPCHSTADDIMPDNQHYPLTEEKSCLECHDPHSSDYNDLLKIPGSGVCLDCHDPPSEKSVFIHPPYSDVKCTNCHNPHGSIFDTMFQMPAGYLCLSCHDSIFGGQTPDNMHAADDVRSCDNCHIGHSSENENLLIESHPDLCLNCHKSLREIMNNGLAHSPIPTDGCLPCHTTHFKKDGSALMMNLPQLCFECHPKIRELIDSDFPHAAVEEGCISCHNPHQRFSDDDISELCSECHDVEDDSLRKAHFNIDPVHCAACHDPHGSSSKTIMRANEHPPFQDRDCGACHESDQNILKIKNDKLCLDCHDRPEATGGHVKELILNKICLDCHSPHASDRDFLIK